MSEDMSEWKEKLVEAILDKLRETDTPYGYTDKYGLINLYTVSDVEDVIYDVLREE